MEGNRGARRPVQTFILRMEITFEHMHANTSKRILQRHSDDGLNSHTVLVNMYILGGKKGFLQQLAKDLH